jgi:hypothetical protein
MTPHTSFLIFCLLQTSTVLAGKSGAAMEAHGVVPDVIDVAPPAVITASPSFFSFMRTSVNYDCFAGQL